jgi:hypothetical protein
MNEKYELNLQNINTIKKLLKERFESTTKKKKN